LAAVSGTDVLDKHIRSVPVRELSYLLLPRALEVCALRENINRKSRRVAGLLQPVAACTRAQSARRSLRPYRPWKRRTIMSTNQETQSPAVAAEDLPQPASALAPEVVVDQLRAISARMGEVAPLTAAQRKALHGRIRTSNPILQASINVIGASDNVSQAVGQPAEDVRSLYEEANRWTEVEDQLRTMLNGVSGANLLRRQRIALIAAQAYAIGSQLARDPANAVLVPHVQEIKRLRSFIRRKKAARAPKTPASPAPGTTASEPAPQSSGTSGKQQA
jgi:hypothetical protein